MKTKYPRQAIAAFCKECIYDPLAGGTWRMQTANCKITTCPLYEHRPLDAVTKEKSKKSSDELVKSLKILENL